MFNSNSEFLDANLATVKGGSRMHSERMARGRSVGSKDITNEATVIHRRPNAMPHVVVDRYPNVTRVDD